MHARMHVCMISHIRYVYIYIYIYIISYHIISYHIISYIYISYIYIIYIYISYIIYISYHLYISYIYIYHISYIYIYIYIIFIYIYIYAIYIYICVCVCILYKQKPMSSIFQDLHPIRSRCFGTVPTSSCPTKAPRRVGSPPFPNGGGVGKHSLGGHFNGDFMGIS